MQINIENKLVAKILSPEEFAQKVEIVDSAKKIILEILKTAPQAADAVNTFLLELSELHLQTADNDQFKEEQKIELQSFMLRLFFENTTLGKHHRVALFQCLYQIIQYNFAVVAEAQTRRKNTIPEILFFPTLTKVYPEADKVLPVLNKPERNVLEAAAGD